MTVTIDSFGITDLGTARGSNDDNFLIVDIRKSVDVRHTSLPPTLLENRFGAADGHLLVVADGVGGGPAGDQASKAAITALLSYVSETVGCFHQYSAAKEHELFDRLEDSVRGVHEQLRTDDKQEGGQSPATTVTMVLLIWPRAYLIHVGDSRAYVRRRNRVQRLTHDQTLGEYMVGLGAWTEEQAAVSGPAATLSSAIGGPDLEPVIGLVDLEPGDSIMLCTDGLTRYVSDDRIATVLGGSANAETIARQLLDEALAGGGRDNITVIVMRSRPTV
ncbi:MAG: PP2C family protein-serine/threonine phosphatase [Gemmatimonadaceae bacterium]